MSHPPTTPTRATSARRPRRVSSTTRHVATIALALGGAVGFSAGSAAQPGSTAPDSTSGHDPEEATALSVARAFDERMTVWQAPDGRRTYASHCRAAPGGCRARIALYARLIARLSLEQDVDPFLVAAVVLRESGLNPFAEGSVGERGIVQLHPRGAGSDVEFVQSEPYRRRCRATVDACQGEVLRVGIELLANSIRRCGGVEAGLGMYNGGTCQSTSYSRRVLSERSRLLELAKRGTPDAERHSSR
ncbi:MAG: transglycosylase SLT domain-containing protein [Sandaracinaceae bacterium]|nr:transglycosylase SLT domain-containing protein [Sandaracinaceae bacterium]